MFNSLRYSICPVMIIRYRRPGAIIRLQKNRTIVFIISIRSEIMDSKVIIAIAVAAVVVAAGAGAAIYFMNKDNDDPKSDYSLLTSVKTDGAKGGLYYIYENDAKGIYQKAQIITAEGTTATDIHISRELTTKYSDYTQNLSDTHITGNWQFIIQFFDFTQPEKVPAGVTVSEEGGKYSITGEGKIGEESAKKTVKFSDDFYITVGPTGMITDAKGTATVDGKYAYGYNTVDYENVKWKFADGKVVVNGKYIANIDDHYTSTEAFVDAEFRTFNVDLHSSVITETKDVNHKGVDCKEYTIKGTFMGKQEEGKVYAINGYLIDSEGKENGEAVSEKVQIYYV